MGKNVEIKCPHCQVEQTVTMPDKGCLAFHKCKKCGEVIAPKEGDCCVVCSYSDEKCPVSTLK